MVGFRSRVGLNEEEWKGGGLKAIKSTVHDFASNTTIHGVAYVFNNAVKVLDNILWFFIVCLGAGIAIYMSLHA